MPRTPLTTPAAGSTDWRGWADQLGTEHEALFSDTPGGIDATTQAKVRANVAAQKQLPHNPTQAEIDAMAVGTYYTTGA